MQGTRKVTGSKDEMKLGHIGIIIIYYYYYYISKNSVLKPNMSVDRALS